MEEIIEYTDFTDQELCALFIIGSIEEVRRKGKLSQRASFEFPQADDITMRLYENLLEAGYYPQEYQIQGFLEFLRKTLFQEVPQDITNIIH